MVLDASVLIILALAIGYLVIVYGLLTLAHRVERRSKPES
ncbi:hypothetical protein XM38_031760 [Halomicronema hongdechloris C2206]|uniref:Uncharacterized protein n=1 Tax=Halomicronema hongdechloris C2206 TaxID=1641165 RepID=A0A1Z3HPJ6_9CYAN|nr:hypothetical protein XM38_031760 [Halomicronema hongdechloris C2206]